MQRTLAMRVYIAAYAVLLGLLAYLVLSVAGVVPQLAEREGNVSLGFVLVFSTIFGLLYIAVIVAAALWRDAPQRRWFWLAGTLPALIFFGPDVSTIAGMITQPSWAAFVGLLMLVSLGTLIVAAVASYRDARQAPG
jgi:hypothetical protein